MIESDNDQLSVGLKAQLLGHCIGIDEVRVRIAVRVWKFQAFLASAKVALKNCEDHTHSKQ